MKATKHEYGKVQSAMFKLFQRLGETGGEIITQLDEDAEFTERVARYMLEGGTVTTEMSHKIARAIMGDSMLGVEKVQRFYGVTLSVEELEKAKKISYSDEKLSACRDSHLLVFGYPLFEREVASASRFRICFYNEEYPEGQPAFLTDSVAFGWYLISRRIVTSGGSFELGEGNRLPTRAETIYAYVLRNLVSPKSYPLRDTVALCRETAAGGEVYMGYFNSSLITWKKKPVLEKKNYSKPVSEGALAVALPDS